jgi:DNA-binding HxlR family transcriptional regulator
VPVRRAMEVCPVEVAVSAVGGTWKLTVIKHLLEGTRRFNELGRLLPLANTKTLTRQLRELEEDGWFCALSIRKCRRASSTH